MSRQFTFAVAVSTTEPVRLTEHDACRWVAPGEDAPVTEAVANVIATYRNVHIGCRNLA